MEKIFLLVKGNEDVAVREASKRGIRAYWETDIPGRNEARLWCHGEHSLAVGRWFSENPGPPPEGGYPVGTLLHYSHAKAEENEQLARYFVDNASDVLDEVFGN